MEHCICSIFRNSGIVSQDLSCKRKDILGSGSPGCIYEDGAVGSGVSVAVYEDYVGLIDIQPAEVRLIAASLRAHRG